MSLEPVVGSRIAAECVFRIAGVATDPTTVTAKVLSPNGVLTTVAYPDDDLVREDIGTFRFEFNATLAGAWNVRLEATGTVEAVGEQQINVQPSLVV